MGLPGQGKAGGVPNEDFFSEGGSAEAVAAVTSDISSLAPPDLMPLDALPPRPDFMKTRFPVSMEEYRALSAAAAEPDLAPMAFAPDDTVTEDQSTTPASPPDDEEPGADVPEDGIVLGGQAGEAQAPATGHSFDATTATGMRPPDCTMAVGPNDVLVSVNVDLACYRKDGSLRFRWPNMNALFKSVIPPDANLFDPKLAYDHYAQRWIVVVAARRKSPNGSWILLAASKGADPVGPYWVWALDFTLDGSTPSANWADYPTLGFDTQAVYISTNQFKMTGTTNNFQYAKIRVLTKADVYAGAAIGWWDFWKLKNTDDSFAFTVQPATHFRGPGRNPPAYFANGHWPSGNTLTLWELQSPTAGADSTLQRFDVPCRAYDLPPDADQKGTQTKIETNDPRLLNAVFQYAGGVQRLWVAMTVKVTWSDEPVARSGVQWYEIDVPSRTVAQQGVYGARGFYYYFPAIQTDANRNAYLLFGRSNAAEFASLRQTGRRSTDAANALQSSVLVKAGESTYTEGRYGDYFGNARDPVDPGRAWMYGEYADASNKWGTWVVSAKF